MTSIPRPGDARAVAAAAVERWNAMQSRLAPVIGEDGFRVLFARSLHLARVEHAWLGREAVESKISFSKLQASLEAQTPEQAQAGNRALMAHFVELLDALIGKALAARLLGRPEAGNGPKRPRKRK